jgi:diguanylate cyclase (GGDEF)-like protein
MSSILSANPRESDIICRYGGEEFLIVLPRMSLDNAFQRVEAWRIMFSSKPVKYGDLLINVTFSAGISGYPGHGVDADTLIALADEALYISKNKGRNCITCASEPETRSLQILGG